MAKLKDDEILQGDLATFIETESDFGFELDIAAELSNIQCDDVRHCGTYTDPATRLPREYDFRVTRTFATVTTVFAIEAKNIRPYFPLLLFRTEASGDEKKIEVFRRDPVTGKIKTKSAECFHWQVAKSLTQVGRTSHDNQLTGQQDGIYNKWAQALGHCQGIIDELRHISRDSGAIMAVVPVVVVPDDRLWACDYPDPPEQVDRCEYLVRRQYQTEDSDGTRLNLTIQRVIFCTQSELKDVVHETPVVIRNFVDPPN